MLLQNLSEVFSENGPLAKAAPDFKPRQAQLELAQAVEEAILTRGTLIAEAGTGTGKTWAYMVPSLINDAKVLISTGTRTLQDQLFNRDIPHLIKAMQISVNVALLKGRANYVCHLHLQRLMGEGQTFKSRKDITYLREIKVFAERSNTGDKSELTTVPETADIWSRVTSTRENCLGQECPHVRDCFVYKARRRAQEADVVVINHALFMADLALRTDGVTDLLPDADVVVFDEAHQLPDVATRFLGSSVSSYQLLDLCKNAEVQGMAQAREAASWSELATNLDTAVKELRLQVSSFIKTSGGRVTYQEIPSPDKFDEAYNKLIDRLDRLTQALESVNMVSPELASLAADSKAILHRCLLWSQPDRQGNWNYGIENTYENAQAVRWLELSANFMRIHRAPLSVANIFSSQRPSEQAWVFTSATLSVRGNFQHFSSQMGMENARTECWEAPFDYTNQAMLYVPNNLPLPSSRNFNVEFVNTLLPLIKESSGGVMVLCTTLRAVDSISELLAELLSEQDIKRELLRQGDTSRGVLLNKFRQLQNAVLVGSTSFWEGVDIPGNALSVLAIDKLPFAPPDDPVIEARISDCKRRGGNPFMEYQIPEAAIALKQGAGRLIRSETDRGLLMVGDTRLVDKPYGRVLWRGLPPFARTRDPGVALEFVKAS